MYINKQHQVWLYRHLHPHAGSYRAHCVDMRQFKQSLQKYAPYAYEWYWEYEYLGELQGCYPDKTWYFDHDFRVQFNLSVLHHYYDNGRHDKERILCI